MRAQPERRLTGTSQNGYALVMALGVLTVVTFLLSILEMTLDSSLESSRLTAARLQAEWACHGAVLQAAWDPPDSLVRYDYFGTRVQVTPRDPPLEVLGTILDAAAEPVISSASPTAPIRMYCAVAATPALGSTAEATWYYVIQESRPPVIWASWPGLERSEPYK
ncbi:MAG: hypothetical protein AMXMBFR75_16940 [Candidatus Hinthialibacteria bacterium]